ncbi:hypothetical protein [Saezia sanguinis]|uniref:hypothetical protein n=1 Tax=Saezia sanguinis TaxID=1965230 RepID=UPI0030617BB5
MLNFECYLSSLESTLLKPVRKCAFIQSMTFDTGKIAVLAAIAPPLVGQAYNSAKDIELVVLTSRHQGENIASIRNFPFFVFISRPLIDDICNRQIIHTNELEILAWGELYRTAYDAQHHIFE